MSPKKQSAENLRFGTAFPCWLRERLNPGQGGLWICLMVSGCCNKVIGTRRIGLRRRMKRDMGSWLYGIVYMAEPAEGNSRYWYRAAGRPFPGMGAPASEMAEFESAFGSESPG
jgi:hypothetical protein